MVVAGRETRNRSLKSNVCVRSGDQTMRHALRSITNLKALDPPPPSLRVPGRWSHISLRPVPTDAGVISPGPCMVLPRHPGRRPGYMDAGTGPLASNDGAAERFPFLPAACGPQNALQIPEYYIQRLVRPFVDA